MDSLEPEAIEETTVVPQKSRWEDVIDVFFSPAELFRRRATDRFGPPLIILLVLSFAFYYILLPARGMMVRSQIPAEMMAKMQGTMMNVMVIAGGVSVPIMLAIMTFVTAGAMWLLAKLVGESPTFRETMLVATYAGYIYLLNDIASSIAIMAHGEAGLEPMKHMSFGVLRFMDKPDHKMAAALSILDLFRIWQAILWVIGLQIVAGMPRAKAAIVAAVTLLLGIIPGLLSGDPAEKMGNMQIKTGD